MELTRKTTILFPPDLHRRLTELAARRGRSFGDLVREACVAQYGVIAAEEQRDAVAALAKLELPVSHPTTMKVESVLPPSALLS